MATDSQTFDPYRSPSLPEGPYAGAPPCGRPGLLTALCVLSIVLGALGLMNTLLGAAGAVGGRALQAVVQPRASASLPQDMQDAQNKFQDDLAAVQTKFLWPIVGGLVVRFVAALLLLIGGIRALGLAESGRKLLIVALTVAAVFELGHAILQSIVNLETMTAVNSYIQKMTNSLQQENAPPGTQQGVQVMMRFFIIAGLVFAYLIALAKIGLYVGGLVYLQRKPIRSLFHGAPEGIGLKPEI